MSRYGCEVEGCEAHPSKGDAILRVSPKGTPFRGRCAKHLDTDEQRAELARCEHEAARFLAQRN